MGISYGDSDMPKGKKATAAKQNATPSHWGGERDVEELDTTPVEMPLGADRPMSLQEMIARSVHQVIQDEKAEEMDSWDEANDFEEETDELLDFSPYELQEMEPEGDPTALFDEKADDETASEAPQEQIGDDSVSESPESPKSGDGSPDDA